MDSIDEWLARPDGLAQRLKRLREASRLTGTELADEVGWRSHSKVSKIENGQQPPSAEDVEMWAQATGAGDQVPALLALREEERMARHEWKVKLRTGGHAGLQQEFDQLARKGEQIYSFQILVIPGLLQTPGYARSVALKVSQLHGLDLSKIDEQVAKKMQRAQILYDQTKTFTFCFTEAAFRIRGCPPEEMLIQIDRLLSVFGLPNVTIGIIPLDTEPDIIPVNGFFMVDDVVTSESFTGENPHTKDAAAKHLEIMEKLMASSVTGPDARQLLLNTAEQLRQVIAPEGERSEQGEN